MRHAVASGAAALLPLTAGRAAVGAIGAASLPPEQGAMVQQMNAMEAACSQLHGRIAALEGVDGDSFASVENPLARFGATDVSDASEAASLPGSLPRPASAAANLTRAPPAEATALPSFPQRAWREEAAARDEAADRAEAARQAESDRERDRLAELETQVEAARNLQSAHNTRSNDVLG